jgi:MSHA biogenesis protein MshL
VLSVVRDVYGYAYKYNNNIYTVYSKQLSTDIYPINYIVVKRIGMSDTSVLTGNIQSSSQTSSDSGKSSEQADLVGAGNTISPGSRIQTRAESDFWSSLRSSLAEIKGENIGSEDEKSDNKTKIIVNQQAGMVIVTAMPGKLESVPSFLNKAQLSLNKQVIIEAKILEIELSSGCQAGINWGEINGQLLLSNNVSEFSSPNTINTVAEGVGEVFSSLIKITDLSKLLSLLKTQGNVQVLSSPRVSTVNNQKALIRVGTDRFFVTGISNTTTTSSGATTTTPEVELASFFSGISLDVTPQIPYENEVILHIYPVIVA